MADAPAQTPAPTPAASYNVIQNILHYAISVAGLFAVGGAFAVPGIWGQLIGVAAGTVATVGGVVLTKIPVKHDTRVGEILDKVEAIHDAVVVQAQTQQATI